MAQRLAGLKVRKIQIREIVFDSACQSADVRFFNNLACISEICSLCVSFRVSGALQEETGFCTSDPTTTCTYKYTAQIRFLLHDKNRQKEQRTLSRSGEVRILISYLCRERLRHDLSCPVQFPNVLQWSRQDSKLKCYSLLRQSDSCRCMKDNNVSKSTHLLNFVMERLQ